MHPPATPRTKATGTRHLVLVGAGACHLQVLARLAREPLPGVRVSLVAGSRRALCATLLPFWMADPALGQPWQIDIGPLLAGSGVEFFEHRVALLDAPAQTLALDDGQALPYDLLSVDTGPDQNRAAIERQLPGAREHGLFLWPGERLLTLWPRVLELPAAGLGSLAVIGSGATAIQAALAVRHRLPASAVTLVTGGAPASADMPAGLARLVGAELRRHAVNVLTDRVLALHPGEVLLGCGARLACDVPLVALEPGPPAWLHAGGLALDPEGHLALDADLASISHAGVRLAPGSGVRPGHGHLDEAADAARAARWYAASLLSDLQGQAKRPAAPGRTPWQALRLPPGVLLAGWGRFGLRSKWLGRHPQVKPL